LLWSPMNADSLEVATLVVALVLIAMLMSVVLRR
jgi:hypothetical protein